MGQPNFGGSATYPAPPVPHALHDDDADVVDGDLDEALDDGLLVEPTIEPEPERALPLGCRPIRCTPPISRSTRCTNS